MSNTQTPDDNTTNNTQTRWEYLGTVLAGLMIFSVAFIIIGAAAGVLTLSNISQAWFMLYSLISLTAAVWTWGKDTLKAAANALSN